MPKKRKRPRKEHRPRNHPDKFNAQRSLEGAIGAFGRWARERYPEDAAEYEDVARTAVELKANQLGEPSPAGWDADLIEAVVGGLMPAKVLADDDYARAVVPGMRAYLEFLVVSGRVRADDGGRREALRALGEIEPAMVERFGDVENKGMAGRLMSLAMDEGVDVTDQAQTEAFLERFNSMPQRWREHVTGGPDPARAAGMAGIAFDAGGLDRDEEPELPHFDVVVPREEDEVVALRELRLSGRVSELLEWVGSSRTVTGTGALRRKDIPEVARRLGVQLPDVAVHSMWQLTELSDVWLTAIECGILERTATTVRPGTYSEAWRRGEPADVIRLGRALAGQLVLQIVAGVGEHRETPFDAEVSALLAMLLGAATAGAQHDLREFGADLEAGATPAGPLGAIVFMLAASRLERLAEHGVVSLMQDRLRVTRPLGPSFIQPLRELALDMHPVDADGRDARWEAPLMPVGGGPDGEPPPEVAMTYQVKVQLAGSKPPIWRRLRLSGGTPLDELHDILQAAFGWSDTHMHRFSLGHPYESGVVYEPKWQRDFDLGHEEPGPRDEAEVTLAQLAQRRGSQVVYLYDFGDDWIHTITVESVDERAPGERLPRCAGGRRMAPYDDSGGVEGWQMMVDAALDESDLDHEDVREWLGLDPGEPFDPDQFDPDAVTKALQ